MWSFLGRHWIAAYAIALVFAGAIHLLLGAPMQSVFCAVSGALLCLLPAALWGALDMVSLLTLMLGARYCSSAIFYKLALLEPLDQGLYNSDLAFLVILTGLGGVLAAALIARFSWQRGPLFEERYTQAGLSLLRDCGFAGIVFSLLLMFTRGTALGGISGLANKGFVIMPIAWMAANLMAGRPALSRPFIAFFGATSIILLGSNSRLGVALPFVATALFALSYRVRLSRKVIVTGLVVAVVFGGIVAPVMTVVRSQRDLVSTGRLITSSLSALGTVQSLKLLEVARKFQQASGGAYLLRYAETSNNFAERALNVQQLDIVTERAERFGPIGLDRYWQGLKELLPAFMVPEKPVTATPSYVLWVYGLLQWGQEPNIEMTTFGDAYAYNGITFVFLSAFVLYLLIFILFRLFIPHFSHSLLATVVIASYGHVFTASSMLGMLAFVLRELPFIIILFWIATTVRRPVFTLDAARTQ